MSQEELYQWIKIVGDIFGSLGRWLVIRLALYSYGVVLARQGAPSKVAEKRVLAGTTNTMQRRLEGL